jgi:quinolinate synthase
VNLCIAECEKTYPGSQIHVHTDCQKAIRSKYPENVRMHKMIGHVKKDLRDEKQTIFAMVDRAVRKELRKKHKEIEVIEVIESDPTLKTQKNS